MKPLLFLIAHFFFSIAVSAPLEITPITSNAYVYVTYNDFEGQSFPSNSMYLVTQAGIVLLDTPWDSTQFQPLLDSIQIRHNKPVLLCISTHFHDDRTAGLEYYSSQGIATWSSQLTHELCIQHNNPKAAATFTNDTTFKVGEYSIETFYPGEGHSPDNIVIWIPELKILYGGCFIKSVQVKGLGNLSHANPAAWKNSVIRVMEKYPDAVYIIPGHYGWSLKKNALKHTLKLTNKHAKK